MPAARFFVTGLFPCLLIGAKMGDFDIYAKALNLMFRTRVRASDLSALEAGWPNPGCRWA